MAPPLELLGLPVPNTPPLTIEPACRNRRSITPSNPVLCQDTGALVGICAGARHHCAGSVLDLLVRGHVPLACRPVPLTMAAVSALAY
jgi:hypothetical protein